ncbi:MAG: hypothetical protein ACR2QE_18080 [Acidimicrobiales bacterium]
MSSQLLASQPWHFWIGVILAISAVALVLATIIGYFVQVTRTRYPRQ